MIRYGKIVIKYTGKKSFSSIYNKYKNSLCSRVSYINKSARTDKCSNFDCEITERHGNCLHSFVIIENTPMFIKVCKNSNENICKLSVQKKINNT